jgi:hypothetical protein
MSIWAKPSLIWEETVFERKFAKVELDFTISIGSKCRKEDVLGNVRVSDSNDHSIQSKPYGSIVSLPSASNHVPYCSPRGRKVLATIWVVAKLPSII